MKRSHGWMLGLSIVGTLLGGAAQAQGPRHGEHAHEGAVFTVSNETAGNDVLAFTRSTDGSLSEPVAYATGGLGSGDGLGSQSALVLTEDHRFLLAVNAGSNDISSFAVHGAGLELRDRVSSQGARPISVSERGGLVYVLNAGADPNIAGFALDRRGKLHAIPYGTRALSAKAGAPAQVEISHDLRHVLVTEKAANDILNFKLTFWGAPWGTQTVASAGTTPFGFELTDDDVMIVSEAASRSVSSYSLTYRGDLQVTSAAVPDTQVAPCWVTISDERHIAYTANAGSESISSYTIARDGTITLLDAVAGDTGDGSHPLDMGLDADERHLYVLDRGHAVVAFEVQADGSLELVDAAGTLPAFTAGIAAY